MSPPSCWCLGRPLPLRADGDGSLELPRWTPDGPGSAEVIELGPDGGTVWAASDFAIRVAFESPASDAVVEALGEELKPYLAGEGDDPLPARRATPHGGREEGRHGSVGRERSSRSRCSDGPLGEESDDRRRVV